MTEFQQEIAERTKAARRSLEEARREGDDYLIQVRTGEIESLQRLLAEHAGQDVIVIEPTTAVIKIADLAPDPAVS